jgi:hypothetical protein
MRELRQEMKAGFELCERRFERIDERFGKLERTITRGALGLFGTVILVFGTLLATQL